MSFNHVTLTNLFIGNLLWTEQLCTATGGVFKGSWALKKDLRLCVEVGGQESGQTPGQLCCLLLCMLDFSVRFFFFFFKNVSVFKRI